MVKKTIPLAILLLAVFVALFIKRSPGTNPVRKSSITHNDPSQEAIRDHGFDRNVSYLEYTQHAKCRMDCRHITQLEVQEILRNGTINYRKSDMNATPCPPYAVEGTTSENQRLLIVFAHCDTKTKVVTCIDLRSEE